MRRETMAKKTVTAITLLSILCFMFTLGCARKQIKEEPAPPVVREEPAPPVVKEAELEDVDISAHEFTDPVKKDPALAAVFKNIHFDFDRYEIRPDAKPVLNSIAEWMKKNPAVQLMVEGHCDERGTSEYNLALGERRAGSAKRYLVQMGIPDARIFTISYGKERPLDPRSVPEAWAKNRRCQFLIR